MRIVTRGLSFDVYAGGPSDGPAVLLLHGFPQHSGEWELITPALHAAELRTYAVDQRGYSPGARPTDAYAIAECTADALSIMDELGLDAAHVVGHDWGAVVGWHLAARHPGRVRTLTAVSVPHPLAMAQALTADPEQRERSAYVRLFRQAGKAEEALLADGARRLRRLLTGVPAERVEAYVAPMLVPGALTGALGWYRAISPDDTAGMGAVTVPTTFIWSDADVAIGRTAATDCAQHVTGDYRFVPLAGVSHWIPDEAPQLVVDEVLRRTGTVNRG
ncbi:MAG TPA: alpha/beta hydrolase [Micromonosporaceae bacterium]|jgi:pimeloyl-ACP methyl ester carboxylesterase